MSITQLITFLVIVGGLAIFMIQNLSPSLSLIFLGSQLPSLPLSVWIIGSMIAGMLTYGLIASLFKVSQSSLEQQPQRQPQSPRSAKPPVEPFSSPAWEYRSSSSEPPQQASYTVSNAVRNPDVEAPRTTLAEDDWETEVKPFNPAWEDQQLDDETSSQPNVSYPTSSDPSSYYRSSVLGEERWDNSEENPDNFKQSPPPPPIYETEQTPQTESWSGSVYSYGYRDPSSTGVGKTETVYDADYRIITPPASSPPTRIQDDIEPPRYNGEDDEDWGLDEDDDFDNPNRRNR